MIGAALRTAAEMGELTVDMTVRESRAAVRRRVRRHARAAQPTYFDPLDPSVLADPYPWYAELLAGGSVHVNPDGLFVLARWEEVRAAGRAHDALSSGEGVTRQRNRLPMMITSDNPDHARMRRVLARDVTRDALEARRPAIEAVVSELLDTTGADVVPGLTVPLPVTVIADMLGVPRRDLADFRRWSDQVVGGFALGPGQMRGSVQVVRAIVALRDYLARAPHEGLMARLRDSGELTPSEVFWSAFLLLIAGNETTTNLLGTLLHALATHPEQYAKLRAEPSLVGSAVEEALRWVAPIQGLHRTAVSDYGVIPAGARVLLLFGAAGRDPRRYPDPDRFDIDRDASDHVSFGSGIHFCLGAHLARLEARIALEEIVSRYETLSPAGDVVWTSNPNLRGPEALPLRFA